MFENEIDDAGDQAAEIGTGDGLQWPLRMRLQKLVEPFILKSLIQQIKFGLDTSKIYCLGTGKNFKFLNKFNKEHKLFGEIIPLEHPRYIMQYKSKNQDLYVDKFLRLLSE